MTLSIPSGFVLSALSRLWGRALGNVASPGLMVQRLGIPRLLSPSAAKAAAIVRLISARFLVSRCVRSRERSMFTPGRDSFDSAWGAKLFGDMVVGHELATGLERVNELSGGGNRELACESWLDDEAAAALAYVMLLDGRLALSMLTAVRSSFTSFCRHFMCQLAFRLF